MVKMIDAETEHMSALEQENIELWKLLREVQPVLRRAFFAHYEDRNRADQLYEKIAKKVGKVDW